MRNDRWDGIIYYNWETANELGLDEYRETDDPLYKCYNAEWYYGNERISDCIRTRKIWINRISTRIVPGTVNDSLQKRPRFRISS